MTPSFGGSIAEKAQRYGHEGVAVNEVYGAVDWVEYPRVLGLFSGRPFLLAEKPDVGGPVVE
jgi:hypothetical protein